MTPMQANVYKALTAESLYDTDEFVKSSYVNLKDDTVTYVIDDKNDNFFQKTLEALNLTFKKLKSEKEIEDDQAFEEWNKKFFEDAVKSVGAKFEKRTQEN